MLDERMGADGPCCGLVHCQEDKDLARQWTWGYPVRG